MSIMNKLRIENGKLIIKRGFTLTEIIIVLVILGVLALILVPNMLKMVPDDHNIKYKKAFYTIQEIINDMVNDPNTCQGMDWNSGDGRWDEHSGDDILATCYNGTNPRNLGEEICNRLSTAEDMNCSDNSVITNVLTTNGMRWTLPNQTLNNTFNSAQTIYVDVDGGSDAPGNSRNAGNGVYRIDISADGKVTAPNNKLKSNDSEDSGKNEQELLLSNPTDD